MKTIRHTKLVQISASIEELFPLFTPEGEKLWVPGWDYENVMGTTELSEDYLFTTRTHDHGTTDAIWIVKKFDPKAYFVQYYKIEPEDKIGIVTVACTELEYEGTKVQVAYKYMALSVVGEQFISEFNEDAYEEFINEWQTLLRNYFDNRS